MKKRQLYDKKTGKNFVPISHTKAVLTPTGETAEARNTRQQQAVQGTGVSASANRYPFMSLGDVNSIADVNRLLDMAYTSTDTKYQGRLRLRRSGQVAWVDQVLMNSLLGNWVQVLYGCYAPSSTGNSVVVDGKYHILWRQRTGTTSMPWRDLTSQMTLKTINGQSIAGSGNIQISEEGQITIDQELDGDSENAIANKVVAPVVVDLQSQIDDKASKKNGITLIDVWSETIDETSEEKPEGALWWDGGSLYKKVNGEWVDVTDEEEYEDVFFLNQTDTTLHFYTGGGEMIKLFYYDFDELEKRTATHFYHVSGRLQHSYTIESGTYTGSDGRILVDTSVPRVVLAVEVNYRNKYYTSWKKPDDGFYLLPGDYHFGENDFYVWDSSEIYSGLSNTIIFGHFHNGVWIQSRTNDISGNIPNEMHELAYTHLDMDENGHFPDGDETHKYALDYGTTDLNILYTWDTANNEWVEVDLLDYHGQGYFCPYMFKYKNKIGVLWSDEMEWVFDFTPDSNLDETSKNAVENRIVAARINEHSERLDDIEAALPSVRGCKVLPIDGVMPAGYSYLIEDVGYAGEGGELLLDVTNQRVVLALTEDGGEEIATIYFAVWNDAGGRLPNDVYDLTDSTNILFAWEGEGALHFGKLSGETLVEIAAGSTPTIAIDTALNRTSANPVQNAVITSTINNLITMLNNQNERITRMENSATKVVWTIQVWGEDETVYENWAVDDLWWDSAEAELKRCVEAYVPNEPRFVEIEPSTGMLYYLSPEDKWCVWNGEGFDELQREELVISSSTL